MLAGLVLAGGKARRLGGADKAMLRVGGVTMLDRVLAAVVEVCHPVVVVGRERPTRFAPRIEFIVEPEPGGGPVPAVGAGLDRAGRADLVVVVAVDLPLLSPAALDALVGALLDVPADAAAAADDRGRPNPLLAVYRGASLPCAFPFGEPASALIPANTTTVDIGQAAHNVNSPADLRWAERQTARDRAGSPGHRGRDGVS